MWHTGGTLDASHYGPLARPLEGMKEENPLDGKIPLYVALTGLQLNHVGHLEIQLSDKVNFYRMVCEVKCESRKLETDSRTVSQRAGFSMFQYQQLEYSLRQEAKALKLIDD